MGCCCFLERSGERTINDGNGDDWEYYFFIPQCRTKRLNKKWQRLTPLWSKRRDPSAFSMKSFWLLPSSLMVKQKQGPLLCWGVRSRSFFFWQGEFDFSFFLSPFSVVLRLLCCMYDILVDKKELLLMTSVQRVIFTSARLTFVLPIPTWIDVLENNNTSAAYFHFSSMLHYYQRLSWCSPIQATEATQENELWSCRRTQWPTTEFWRRWWDGEAFWCHARLRTTAEDCLKRTKAETMVDCGCETCCSFDNGDMLYRRWIGWSSSLHLNRNNY